MAELGLLSAGGPLPLTQAVPGNLSTGPSGHVRPPYGRTEHGRSRGARGRSPVVVKGLSLIVGFALYEKNVHQPWPLGLKVVVLL